MKKISILILLSSLLLITGCEDKEKEPVISGGEEVDTSKMIHEHCTRAASGGTGVDVSLNYDIYYTGDDLNLLKSEEKVTSSNNETLTTYEEAYNKIKTSYEGLDYYDQEVIRGDTSVTNSITINYDKIDMDKLVAIEGSTIDISGDTFEIYKDGKASASVWKKMAKKVGTTCKKDSEE